MKTIYPIRDIYGELVAEHVRLDLPDGKKRLYWQIPGMHPEAGLCGLSTPDLPLYGSERIPGLRTGQVVVVTEGESSTDALRRLGQPAVATVTGASSCPGEDALSPLLPFDVVLWPDRDEPGEQHMARVAATLLRLGGRARRLSWGRDRGEDAADFLRQGGTGAMLALLIRSATPWQIVPEAPKPVVRPRYESAIARDRTEVARQQLVDVVEARLGPPSKRMGRSLLWCCPFHAEKSPSFKVDLREPFFRCFGCGEKGDVFSFLAKIDALAFPDALAQLAPQAALGGIPRPWA